MFLRKHIVQLLEFLPAELYGSKFLCMFKAAVLNMDTHTKVCT